MPAILEQILIALLVLGAIGYLVRAMRGKKKGGCEPCSGGSTRRK